MFIKINLTMFVKQLNEMWEQFFLKDIKIGKFRKPTCMFEKQLKHVFRTKLIMIEKQLNTNEDLTFSHKPKKIT
jgi:hypothetical protein